MPRVVAEYVGEPFPRPIPDPPAGTHRLDFADIPQPVLSAPHNLPIPSEPVARQQRFPRTLPAIVHGGGIEVPQSGIARAPLDNRLHFPPQNITPTLPVGQRVSRPVPRAWDEGTAIGGGT